MEEGCQGREWSELPRGLPTRSGRLVQKLEGGVVCFLKWCLFCLEENDPAEGGGLVMQGSVGRAFRERSLCT